MRKQLLTIFGVAALGIASYAATFMQVKTNDGKIVKFDVEDVTEVDFMTEEIIPQDTTPVIPSDTSSSIHSYVDLGLPSGTLWATYNIGATKPEEYGDYFAWGETEPKEVYDWSTYKYATLKYDSEWGEYDLDSITKYNMSGRYGKIDNLSTLLSEDDAATANWGSEWRMPTNEELRELYQNSYMVWTDGYNGTDVSGVIFYKAKEDSDKGQYMAPWMGEPSADYSESSDAHVFFPAAGRRDGADAYNVGSRGFYWSSSLIEENESSARYLFFYEEYVDWGANYFGRYNGFSVRAVRVQEAERKMYVVKFYTSDSVLINSQEVLEGASAKEIQAPEKNGYEFIGWSASLDKITSDMSVYALYKEKSPIDTPSSNHSYVDLGLTSGTLWATYNIGATKPEEYGDYFAWGETEPKDVYDWSTYKYATLKYDSEWGEYDLDSITKYNMSGRYGIIDSLSTLLSEDDAATANWGSEWRMPTIEEQIELVEECYWVWTNGYNGSDVSGHIVYKAKNENDKGKVSYPGGNYESEDYSLADAHVFFPAAGYRFGSDVDLKGDYGYYWSSSLLEWYEGNARYLNFREGYVHWDCDYSRYNGFSVRAVRVQKAERKMYVVKFYTSDSVLINSQEVLEGASAKEIQAPEKNGYEFIGWSASLDKITSDMSVYALYKEKSPIDTPSSNHSYVDLGLPSGTLWATYNIGATKPEEYGDYFAWGETEPKDVYDWSTYKYATSKYNTSWNYYELVYITKYYFGNEYEGIIDSLSTLLSEDDAATANWGSEWRMPTIEEQRELIEECYWVWTNGYNGNDVSGHIVYKAKNENDKGKVSYPGGKYESEDYSLADAHVFFPDAGRRDGAGVSNKGDYGFYWSSSLIEKDEGGACNLYFYKGSVGWSNDYRRGDGCSVRAVRAK